ncbi:MAG: hypothetical protein WCI18_02860 [Pseudomonadota bacterium]
MMDYAWVTQEAQNIHSIFVSIFFSLAVVFLLIGVVIEYFKIPLGGMPGFSQLVGRTLIAAVLLISYPEIANAVADVADALANRIGDLNSYKLVLGKAGAALKSLSWSWASIGDSFIFVISYLAFYILHVTVYFFDAAIAYAWVVLYVFSPLLIAFFILPQTAAATSALFRSIFEISGWKIVWSVLGTLLWSSAIHNFENVNEQTNFITILTYTIMLSLSVIFTPLVVRALINKGVAGLAGTLSGGAGTALIASAAGPASLSALATAPAQTLITGARRITTMPIARARAHFEAKREEAKNYSSGVVRSPLKNRKHKNTDSGLKISWKEK